MGILYETACFLGSASIYSKHNTIEKVDFSKTLTLGRQQFFINHYYIKSLLKKHFNENFIKENEKSLYTFSKSCTSNTALFSEPFFITLGAKIIDSLDISDFENATIIHDISTPIPNSLKNKYSLVFDGGLLEHVYDFANAIKNTMDLVALGGHLIITAPGNNWFGHGFYQFSPELFYSLLIEENGFNNTKVYFKGGRNWYLVKNPKEIRQRTEFSPKWSNLTLMVISKKVGEVPNKVNLFQSDYMLMWEKHNDASSKIITISKITTNTSKYTQKYSKFFINCLKVILPTSIKLFLYRFYRETVHIGILLRLESRKQFIKFFVKITI
ncbi:MAG: hypothetical protein LBC73_09400 [Oscillospiraceae bacterium]|jgi:hypothetical protein|nr:hypothetical protein [Oscillospiraceae bacterium]